MYMTNPEVFDDGVMVYPMTFPKVVQDKIHEIAKAEDDLTGGEIIASALHVLIGEKATEEQRPDQIVA